MPYPGSPVQNFRKKEIKRKKVILFRRFLSLIAAVQAPALLGLVMANLCPKCPGEKRGKFV